MLIGIQVMNNSLYVKIAFIFLCVAVCVNFYRLISDVYGAFVITALQFIFIKQMYNFINGKDMNFGGIGARKEYSFEIRLFAFLGFILMYFGLFFV